MMLMSTKNMGRAGNGRRSTRVSLPPGEPIAATSTTVLIFEDLHWADDSSIDALNRLALALREQPVMIVSAARPAASKSDSE